MQAWTCFETVTARITSHVAIGYVSAIYARKEASMDSFTIGAIVVAALVVATWIGALVRTRHAALPAAAEAGAAVSATEQTPPQEQPLAIPKGSVRSMMGLLIVGEFVNFLLFGWKTFGTQDSATFNAVLAAFATLSGAVTGFYFGARSSK